MEEIKISANAKIAMHSGLVESADLLLQRSATANGHLWEIKTRAEVDAEPTSAVVKETLAQGAEVLSLMRQAANGEPLPAIFAPLGKDRSFRLFAKRTPGIETPEHRQAIKDSIHEKAVRVRQTLAIIAKGTTQMKAEGKPYRLVGDSYLVPEIVTLDLHLPVGSIRKLFQAWKESDTTLSFKEWLPTVEENWKASGSTQNMFDWVVERGWDAKERSVYEQQHPGVPFIESDFVAWRQDQYAPESLLAEPKWQQQEMWRESNEQRRSEGKPEQTFDQWLQREIEGRRSYWKEQPEKTEGLFIHDDVDDALFRELDKLVFDSNTASGSSLDNMVWMAKQQWLASHPVDTSDEAFVRHIEQQQYTYAMSKSGVAPLSFEAWKEDKQQQLHARWQAIHTTLPFETWKEQQVLNPLAELPFVSLTPEQRQHYRADVTGGILQRQGDAITTTEEWTGHSGKGWMIFVIGPDSQLHCSSHLPGVFHHSSFYGDSAVMAGGEIKTDSDGNITHLSSKSGHYRPTEAENREMLRWFQSRGVDLDTISFTCFLESGESEPMSGQEYLNGKVPIPKS